MTSRDDGHRLGELTDAQFDQLMDATNEEILGYVRATADPGHTLTTIMADAGSQRVPDREVHAWGVRRVRHWSWRTALSWTLRLTGIAAALAGMGVGFYFLRSSSPGAQVVMMVAILFLAIFFSGIVLGIFAIVLRASNRPAKRAWPKSTPPSRASAGARWLSGVGGASDAGYTDYLHHDSGHSDSGCHDSAHHDSGHYDSGHSDSGHSDSGCHDSGHSGSGDGY